jgi:hypothetical protein
VKSTGQRVVLALVTIALSITLFSCSRLKELGSLQMGIAKEFHQPKVNVNLTNNHKLTVTFPSSIANEASQETRATFSRRVGEYVRDHYARYPELTEIVIAFSSVNKSGMVRIERTEAPFSFTPADLGQPRTKSASR